MKIVWTNRKESFKEDGIHIYNQKLISKLIIPYKQEKLSIKRIIYIHDIESDKSYEVIEKNLEHKKAIERILEKTFAKTYIEKPKTFIVRPDEPIKKKIVPEYKLKDEDWKKPKKRGGMNKWI